MEKGIDTTIYTISYRDVIEKMNFYILESDNFIIELYSKNKINNIKSIKNLLNYLYLEIKIDVDRKNIFKNSKFQIIDNKLQRDLQPYIEMKKVIECDDNLFCINDLKYTTSYIATATLINNL